ncbi:MAG: PQQ-binding-like beta-propeller repeat protein [Acidobacteria bacterium]|nr:PQQ-binding-like beta-propeller repeat protein [Acidobacteriota bacterium]
MKFRASWLWRICFCVCSVSAPLSAQEGEAVFKKHCATCHEGGGDSRAPNREVFKQMYPEQILSILESGVMFVQGRALSPAERRAAAEFVTEKPFGMEPSHSMLPSAFCDSSGNRSWNPLAGSAWNGWGVTPSNSRFQTAKGAGITADEVPRLELKWAFGLPGDYSSGAAQPVVMGGRVFVGSFARKVFSLDAQSGCIHWTLDTLSGVRGAITIGKTGGRFVAYFGDQQANVYAADAATGKLLWKVKVESHPDACITGSPALHDGRLYVPVASREETRAISPEFECCKFRGSMVALDAASGRQRWKTYVIPEEPRPLRKNPIGTQFWGPSGVGIWVAPTLDLKRKLIYVGTGNSYTAPEARTSDAVVAFDMRSGKMAWVRQFRSGDVWNIGCMKHDPEMLNCPDDEAPDDDFAASPILVELKGGRRALIASQKSGLVVLDPEDPQGELLWQQHGENEPFGRLMWGPAADGKNLYVAVSNSVPNGTRGDSAGGIFALDLSSGEKVWFTPPPSCGDKKPCSQGQLAAVTVIPGVVFSGAVDGSLRAYSTEDGRILWDFSTARDFATVNGVKAKGGSINGAGPAVAGGMLFATSGYARVGGILPGNVLLAFSVDGK